MAFEDVLSDEALSSSRYAYRVLFVPINAKRKGQADQVVEFIKSDFSTGRWNRKNIRSLRKRRKESNLPSEIVALMKEKGYDKFPSISIQNCGRLEMLKTQSSIMVY